MVKKFSPISSDWNKTLTFWFFLAGTLGKKVGRIPRHSKLPKISFLRFCKFGILCYGLKSLAIIRVEFHNTKKIWCYWSSLNFLQQKQKTYSLALNRQIFATPPAFNKAFPFTVWMFRILFVMIALKQTQQKFTAKN